MGCDAAWAAGFLDGEGSFLLGRPRPSVPHKPSIEACQVVFQPIAKLQAVLGGGVLERVNRTSTGKPIYQWSASGGVAMRRILPELIPYLTVKREAAELLLAYSHEIPAQRGVRPSPEQLARREELLVAYAAMPERRT